MSNFIKYSILIPVKNGMPFLKYALNSVLQPERSDIEVIVSVDESSDDSYMFVKNLKSPRINLVVPPKGLSMSEHWDFLQTYASGEWQMFLGQDDLLKQNYLTEFDKVTAQATIKSLDLIVARRAYVYWSPLNSATTPAVQYWGTPSFDVIESKHFISKALFNQISYHEGPQMYTSSLVRKNAILRVREKNNGALITGHPQDAFLEAAFLTTNSSFLYSGTPLSFVGTSTKSAGLAISSQGSNSKLSKSLENLANSYHESIKKSAIGAAGESDRFNHGSAALYFYDALKAFTNENYMKTFFVKRTSKIKFDANFIFSSPESRISQETIKLILMSNSNVKFLKFIVALIRLRLKIQSRIISLVSVIFRRVLKRRKSLVRIMGPVSNAEIESLYKLI